MHNYNKFKCRTERWSSRALEPDKWKVGQSTDATSENRSLWNQAEAYSTQIDISFHVVSQISTLFPLGLFSDVQNLRRSRQKIEDVDKQWKMWSAWDNHTEVPSKRFLWCSWQDDQQDKGRMLDEDERSENQAELVRLSKYNKNCTLYNKIYRSMVINIKGDKPDPIRINPFLRTQRSGRPNLCMIRAICT